MEFKVGLHTYSSGSNTFIVSWVRPVCRFFIMNSGTTFVNTTSNHGIISKVTHELKLKRKVDIFFDEIKTAVQEFPELTIEETEKIIADSFLQELLSRRSEPEFRNIVFSIQEHQGEIIQIEQLMRDQQAANDEEDYFAYLTLIADEIRTTMRLDDNWRSKEQSIEETYQIMAVMPDLLSKLDASINDISMAGADHAKYGDGIDLQIQRVRTAVENVAQEEASY